jgi:hypothetical protein
LPDWELLFDNRCATAEIFPDQDHATGLDQADAASRAGNVFPDAKPFQEP